MSDEFMEIMATIGARYVSIETGIPIERIDTGQLEDEDWVAVTRCAGEITKKMKLTERERKIKAGLHLRLLK